VAREIGLGFTGPMPARAIVDTRLSSPSMLRLLALYAWHDRRSLSRTPPGAGCTASNKVLSTRLGCDYSTLLKLRLRLEELGYIEVEARESQYRLEVVRVIPDHLADPAKWPFDPAYIGPDCQKAWNRNHGEVAMKSRPEHGQSHGEATMSAGEDHGDPAISAPGNHGDEFSETRRNPPKTADQYIPRRGGTYSSEEGETYSSEEARSVSRAPRGARPIGDCLPLGRKRNSAEAGLGSGDNEAGVAGMLSRLERAFKADPESIGSIADNIAWLESIVDANPDDNGPIYWRAKRMLDDLDAYAAMRDQPSDGE
jgi:hypothetical protein